MTTETIYRIEDALERICDAVGRRCDCPRPDDSVSNNQELDQCMWCEAREALEAATKDGGKAK